MTENTQKQILNKLEMLITVTQRNEKWFGELSDSVEDLRSQFGDFKSEFGDFKSEFGDFKSEFGDFKSEFLKLRSDVDNLKDNVSKIEGRLSRIESDVAELKAGQEKIVDELYVLSAGMDTLAGEYFRTKGRIAHIDAHLAGRS